MRLTHRPPCVPQPPVLAALVAAAIALTPMLARPSSASGILPEGTTYDESVPHPRDTLGFEVGDWHVRPDQLVGYLERLATSSPRMSLEVQGRTHEGRPQILLTVSSPENLSRIDEIRQLHLAASEPPAESKTDFADRPLVVWLGYSIHGNEASGSNAALLVAYHLAAAEGSEIEELLRSTVILLDPSLNPDGLGRFAHWANMHRGRQPVADPNNREHLEAWPGGRFNHYWFDLNRDWLLLQHPESRARVATLQRWRPNVVCDFHEMGSNSTYFFQPGVPDRRNPLTPERNVELTQAIAEHHARALDAAGSLYYSEESFDDFYYGKGSTYPDIQGAIGILFEQASARGHVQRTVNGRLEFRDGIRNHFLTSFSTLRGAQENRRDLLAYQSDFYREALSEARRSEIRAWVFGDAEDPARTRHMIEILLGHGIEIHRLAEGLEVDTQRFEAARAYLIPAEQRQYRLLRALFEPVTEFPSTTFYDVSTWSLPLAFAMPTAELRGGTFKTALLGERLAEAPSLPAAPLDAGDTVAVAFSWDSYYAPRALYRLLAAGARARVATQPFEARAKNGNVRFTYGAIVVPTAIQDISGEALAEVLDLVSKEDGIEIHQLTTGLTPGGLDLGSPSLLPLKPIKPLLLVGSGISPTGVGGLWHLLDHRFGIELPLVEIPAFERLDLAAYTHVILANGRYQGLEADTVTDLRRWVRAGGTLIATRDAGVWARKNLLGDSEEDAEGPRPDESTDQEAEGKMQVSYGSYSEDRAVEIVSGAIFEIELDLTHPLAFGYRDRKLPVFRSGTHVLQASSDPYENVAFYTSEPRLSGYVSPRNLQRLAGTPAIIASRVGRGSLIRLADDPNFRSYFYGQNKLLLNALFFGPTLRDTQAPSSWR